MLRDGQLLSLRDRGVSFAKNLRANTALVRALGYGGLGVVTAIGGGAVDACSPASAPQSGITASATPGAPSPTRTFEGPFVSPSQTQSHGEKVIDISGTCDPRKVGPNPPIIVLWDVNQGARFAILDNINGANDRVIADPINEGLLVPGKTSEITSKQITYNGATLALVTQPIGVYATVTCGAPTSSKPV